MLIKEFLEANPNPIEPGYVFALLPEKTKDIYQDYVKKAAESLGLRCESFLDFKQPGDAFRDILTRIQKAEILIYDITDFTPNVMWELGLGLAIKDAERVIVIREQSDSSLPFNIYSHRVSFEYDSKSEESLNELSKTLRDAMQKINKAGSRKAPIQSPEVKSLLDNARKAVERKEWIAAEALFQVMDMREPENWFIHNQWGIKHRSKGELESAIPEFQKALEYTESDKDKAFIYTELAVSHQMNRKYEEAEDWFLKAEEADSENNRLSIAWAEFYDELGDHFSAQSKIGGALARIKRKDDDPNYKELKLRHAYYEKKIRSRTYRKSFEQFKHEAAKSPVRDRATRDVVSKGGGYGDAKGSGSRTRKDRGERSRSPKEFFDANPNLIKPSMAKPPQPVLLGASAPRAVRPGDSFVARFAAYTKRFERAIETQLAELSPDAQTHLSIRETRWQIGTRVRVRLSSPHLKVSPREEEFSWQGRKEILDFNVRVPSDVPELRTVLDFNVLIGGISVAKFLLELGITSQQVERDPINVTVKPASTAFASYASKDRLRVMDRLTEVRRSGLEVFVDCLDLKPGERWKPRLEQEITGRDRFLLFWSAHAKKSKWVQWEWETALRKRGLAGIDPHPLDDAKPPEELRELHFGDLYMQARKAFEKTSLDEDQEN